MSSEKSAWKEIGLDPKKIILEKKHKKNFWKAIARNDGLPTINEHKRLMNKGRQKTRMNRPINPCPLHLDKNRMQCPCGFWRSKGRKFYKSSKGRWA